MEVIAPAPELLTIPLLISVKSEQVPPMFKVPVELFVNCPDIPDIAVFTVSVPLLV